MLEEGTADMKDIDYAMQNGTGMPLGPFRMADLIGLDTCLASMQRIFPNARISKILGKKIECGELGRKTGKGFYSYLNIAS